MLPEAMGAACKSLDIHITEYLENIMEKNHRRLACNLSHRRKTVQKFYK
jgi:hypothetical protein